MAAISGGRGYEKRDPSTRLRAESLGGIDGINIEFVNGKTGIIYVASQRSR
jgi:hypothetical protein